MKQISIFIVLLATFGLAACGGGGSSSVDMNGNGDGDGTAMMCPEGQTGTPPNCMEPGPTAEELAAATKAAGTKRMAIAAESSETGTSDAGLGGSAADGADDTLGTTDDPYMMEISRNRDGTTVKITDSGLAGEDDPKFMQAMDLGSGTTMHSRMMEADDDGNVEEEIVIVTTNIEAPKATAFAMVEGQGLTVDPEPTVDADNDGTPGNDFTAITVAEAGLEFVMSSAFPTSRSATLNFAGDDSGTANADEAEEVSGTYNGATGTYRCNTDPCTVVIGDTDATAAGIQLGISAMTNWVFIPDAGATSDVADADYLHYGVWLKKTTDEDGVVTYNEVETFAGSSVERTTDADIATGGDITGTATYEGGATGVYVHSVLNPDGTEASATSGHFTADAVLTAYFNQTVNDDTTPADEGGQIAPNLLNSISVGTIDNFMLSGHDEGPGWSVTLEQGAIDGTTPAPHVSGTAKGGGADGNYQATFHGGGGDGNAQPTAVVGEFNAFFSNGSVAGGFGADKKAE